MSRSADGGRRWSLIPLKGSTQCNGGSEPKTADPALAWAPDGRSYLLANPGSAETGIPVTRLVFYRLDPDRRRYTGPLFIPAPVGYNDRPSMTIDPSNPRRLEVIWTFRHQKPELDALDDVMIATSNNRGRTWSVRKVYTGAANEFIWGLQLFHIGTSNRLIIYRGNQGTSSRFYALRSHDGGHTWSAPTDIGSGSSGYPVSEGKVMPPGSSDFAAQGPDGSVGVAWNSTAPDGRGRILITRTADAGRSWSHPRVVAHMQCDAFMPAVAVNGRGTIGVSYYAFRECGAGQQGPEIDVRFAASGDEGRHWRSVRLGGPFDVRNVITPEHGGHPFPAYFLGDYMGPTALGDDFAATFILPKPYAHFGQQNVFFRRIKAG